MASIISAGTSSGTSLNLTGDTSGVLQLASNNGTTAVTIDTSQNLQLAAAGAKILNSSGRPILQQSGSVLQVVSTTKTDTFSTSSTSFTDITGLSVSITPSSASSKIFVTANLVAASGGAFYILGAFRLVRDSTAICVGNTTSGYASATVGTQRSSADLNSAYSVGMSYLDSPSTTSSITYKVQVFGENASFSVCVNRTGNDTGSAGYSARSASTITVMEIAA